jgi:sulfur transfer protein SufE
MILNYVLSSQLKQWRCVQDFIFAAIKTGRYLYLIKMGKRLDMPKIVNHKTWSLVKSQMFYMESRRFK